MTKGPYYRLVGRHTQRYSLRIAGRSRNKPAQQKVLLVALTGADEWAAEVLGVSANPDSKTASARQLPKKSTKTKTVSAMRIYLSALLILMGGYKNALLSQLEFDERGWVDFWCQVFEYQPDDMDRFDKVFLPEYQRAGLDGLIGAVVAETARLFERVQAPHEIEQQRRFLQTSFIKDLTAVERALNIKKEGFAE